MNIKFYEYIKAIAEEGSLLKAAARLGLSQPALSHFLTSAEFQIGHPLFSRSSRGLTPTAVGWVYIQAADEIIRIKAQTYHNIRRLSSQEETRLILGATPHRGAEIYSSLYRKFTLLYPNVRLSSREGYMKTLIQMLLDGKIDFLLGSASDFRQKEYRFLRFFREEIVLAVSEHHPLAAYAGFPQDLKPVLPSLKEVEDIPFVKAGPNTTLHQITVSLFESQEISPTVVFETDNAAVQCEMIRSNQGIGFLPATYVYRNPDLRCFSLEPKAWVYAGMYHLNGRHLTGCERHMICMAYEQSKAMRLNQRFLEYPDGVVQDILKEFSPENGADVKERSQKWS